MRSTTAVLLAMSGVTAAAGQTAQADHTADFHLGPISFHPSGYFGWNEEWRSARTGDTISTRFGSIPLEPSEGETLGTVAYSKVILRSIAPLGRNADFKVALEADFLQTPDRAPWRWRQYSGEFRVGRWKLLGGLTYTMLRPNRHGTSAMSEDVWRAAVPDANQHVGVLGSRRKELRVTGDLGRGNSAGFAWSSGGRFEAKLAHDWSAKAHVEAVALAGTRHRLGFALGHSVAVSSKVRLVGEEFWSRGGGPEMLGILPGQVHAYSVLEGVEIPLRRGDLSLYSYGGLGYAARNDGNKFAREYTFGGQKRLLDTPDGNVMLNVQFSQVDRALWDGRSGSLTYVMTSVRYYFPPRRQGSN